MRWQLGACLWLLFGLLLLSSERARAQPQLDSILGSANFPVPHGVMLTLMPPPPRELVPLLTSAKFPATHNVTLTLTPPPSLDQALAGAQFPAPHNVTLMLESPLNQALASGQFPTTHNVTLTLMPPPPRELVPLFTGAKFPATHSATLTLVPPSGIDQTLSGVAFPATHNVTLTLTPAPPQPTSSDSNPYAAIANASFPTPQTLSVILVPPPSPYSAITGANFPAPQSLSVVLVPPPSPYSAIADANFPAPQTLSVVLVPGPVTEQAAGGSSGGSAGGGGSAAPTPSLQGGGDYSVQIVQVIVRRGVNFFDRNDPTGQSTVQVTQPSGPPAPPPPPPGPVLVCGTEVFTDGHGIPSLIAPPNVALRIIIPGNIFVNLAPGSIWDSISGAFSVVPPFPPATATAVYTIGCPTNTSTNGFALRFSTGTPGLPGEFCVTRQALQTTNCDAQGN